MRAKINDDSIMKKFKKHKNWGLCTAVDLKDCNIKTIRDAEKVKQFVKELCELIGMKRYGETVVVDFGDDPKVTGFSMTQLIETSLISGHFGSGYTKYVYLDIFSCKEYPPSVAAEFCKKFFEAKEMDVQVTFRK